MSKRDYYEVLGLTKAATDDDIKKAYRRLSSAHHPDKHTAATEEERAKHEALFKEAKEAYETLSDASKRAAYDSHGHSEGGGWQSPDLNDLMEMLKRARGADFARAAFKQVTQFQTAVSLKEAYEGFSVNLRIPTGATKEVKVPPGTPDGYRFQVDVSPNLAVLIITRIHDDGFRVKNAAECGWHTKVVNGQQVVVIETGDIETTVKVDAIDVLMGAWVTVPSFEGERLQVRVPAGLSPEQRLKVKGKGYYHWMHDLNQHGDRGDLYVKVEPVFTPLKSIPLSKAEALVTAIKALQEPK